MKYRIPFIRPDMPSVEDMIEDYKNIVESNWYTNFGPYEKELSKQAGIYIGRDVYATTVANCTQGIDLAIRALFHPSKKKVLMQSFTFAAGAEMVIQNGYKPVFIDVDENTMQMDVSQAEAAILDSKHNVAGILLCNTFGVGNERIGEWEELAKKYDIPLVIDTAAGFGSRYFDDELVGARGDCEIFSLHATKPFAVGEGGLVTSKSDVTIEKIRALENFGFSSDRTATAIGTNAKMQEISCAIGVRQLKLLKDRIAKRQAVLAMYKERLASHGFGFQSNDLLSTVAFVTVVVPEGTDATMLQKKLDANSVEARRYYVPALHQHDEIAKQSEVSGVLNVTNMLTHRVLSLPLLNSMTSEDVGYICDILITTDTIDGLKS